MEAPTPAPQLSVLMESSQQFWEEGTIFSVPFQLCLFVSGRTHTGGASVMHPAWEFCLVPVQFSVYNSLTVSSSLKSVFYTGKLTVASLCFWLIVLIAAVMNCVGTYWEIEKYPLDLMVFLVLEKQEMPDQCSFQISPRLNFQGSHLNAEQASVIEHFLSQEKEFMSN